MKRQKQKQIKQMLNTDLAAARRALQDGIPKLREQLAAIEAHILTTTGGVLEHPHRSDEQNFYIAERHKLMVERRMVHVQISDLISTERDLFTEWTRY